jgi:hypothetical protein
MPGITTIDELREAIRLLEIEQKAEGILLKEQFKITYESLKPANLIANTIKELNTNTDFKGDLLNTTLGLAAGYLSKKVVIGNNSGPLKQLLGTFLQMGVSALITKNADSIKSFGSQLFSHLLTSKKTG